jgi:hypothetical protein
MSMANTRLKSRAQPQREEFRSYFLPYWPRRIGKWGKQKKG